MRRTSCRRVCISVLVRPAAKRALASHARAMRAGERVHAAHVKQPLLALMTHLR